jgi:hypothetical protein
MVESGSSSKICRSHGEFQRVKGLPRYIYAFRNTKETNPPPAEFSLFPKLIPELRSMIWRFVALSSPRIVEIRNGSNSSDRRYECEEYKITCTSSRAPTIMHVNRESRTEAMRIYRKYIFSTSDDTSLFRFNRHLGYCWFNPHLDIIYLNTNGCIKTLDVLLRRHPEITKVALSYMWKMALCIGCDIDDGLGREYTLFRIWRAMIGRSTTQPAYYTGSGNQIRSEPVPGAKKTGELFFVVDSQMRNTGRTFEIKPEATFRPPLQDGIWHNYRQCKQTLEAQISTARKTEGENRLDDMDTKVSFVSFAPPVKQSKGIDLKHSGIMVPQLDFPKLDFCKEPFPELLSRTGCEIEVSKLVNPELRREANVDFEIGIYNGTDEGIEEVKCAIKKKIEEASS